MRSLEIIVSLSLAFGVSGLAAPVNPRSKLNTVCYSLYLLQFFYLIAHRRAQPIVMRLPKTVVQELMSRKCWMLLLSPRVRMYLVLVTTPILQQPPLSQRFQLMLEDLSIRPLHLLQVWHFPIFTNQIPSRIRLRMGRLAIYHHPRHHLLVLLHRTPSPIQSWLTVL